MTGLELKKIYKESGLNGDEFASKLGIHRGYLYKLFTIKNMELIQIQQTVEKLNAQVPYMEQQIQSLIREQNNIFQNKLTYSLKEASQVSGYSVRTLRLKFTSGEITGKKTDKNIFIHAHSLKEHLGLPQLGK